MVVDENENERQLSWVNNKNQREKRLLPCLTLNLSPSLLSLPLQFPLSFLHRFMPFSFLFFQCKSIDFPFCLFSSSLLCASLYLYIDFHVICSLFLCKILGLFHIYEVQNLYGLDEENCMMINAYKPYNALFAFGFKLGNPMMPLMIFTHLKFLLI